MLIQVTGPAGSGKTEYLYKVLQEKSRQGGSFVWIAPEQQSVQTEKDLLDLLGDECSLSLEVLNFERLPEHIARIYGGLNVRYPDKGALCALLSVLGEEHKKELSEYGGIVNDEKFVTGLFGLFGKLRSELVTPEKLEQAAKAETDGGEKLCRKLHDLAILYRAYDSYFTEEKRDFRDALSVLASELPEKPFFKNKTVFVDGYYTFTGQEYKLLSAIIKQADEVYCTFTFDGREVFENNESAAFKLAKWAGDTKKVFVGEYRRSESDELQFLEKYLFADETPPFAGQTGAVSVIRASDPFAESAAVAKTILSLVRSGMRYRDIVILARNPGDYEGVLDAVLERDHIPFWFSKKEELSAHPLVAFAFAALELADTDFSLYALRKYIKTGCSGLENDDGDLLLRYAECWKLRSKDWLSGTDWTKNPDGYREGEPDEEQASFLASVNFARKQIYSDLAPLRKAIKDPGRTVDSMLDALYRHLETVGAGEHYVNKVNALLAAGKEEEARKDAQVWTMLSSVFDRIHESCGSKKMPASRLLALLQLTAGAYSLGSIPTSMDSVSFGDPALFRASGAKAVIVMGCNDGVFPASAPKDPLFDEDEAVLLEDLGIPAVEPRLSVLNAERFYFYSAVSAPKEKLIFTYPVSTLSGEGLRRSAALTRVEALLPHLLPEAEFDDAPENALYSLYGACEVFPLLPDGEGKEKLKKLLSDKGIPVPSDPVPVTDADAKICFRGESLRLSASSIERYRYCPFSYFGSAVMKLKEKKTNRFATPEIGTFLHRILELYLTEHTKTGVYLSPENEEALEKEAEALAKDCFLSVMGRGEDTGKRLEHTFRNLKKTLILLLTDLNAEFRAGSFLPVGFEVGFGMGKDSLPAVEFTTEDGKKVYFCGSIDRVDLYEKDGVKYVRVVDYKTYQKTLNLELAERYGLDEQMLLYLFAYCKTAASDGEVLQPAGVLYDRAILPFAETEGGETDEEIKGKLFEKLTRTGLILEDDGIADAMDPSHGGRYLPVKYEKDGRLKAGKNTLTAERFRELEILLENQMKEMASQVFSGEMDVRPLRLNDTYDACHYCKFRAACRRKENDRNA